MIDALLGSAAACEAHKRLSCIEEKKVVNNLGSLDDLLFKLGSARRPISHARKGIKNPMGYDFLFTDEFCEKFKCLSGYVRSKTEKRGSGSLVLKAWQGGKKSWVALFVRNGKEARVTVGYYPEMSICQAREKFDKLDSREGN